MSEPNRYSAFVSYRHMPRDRQWAIRIMAELEAYRTPKALQLEAFPDRIGRLFRDEDEIPASTDLSDQIKDALARSDFLVVVCSPDTPASRWVRREIELFQEMGKSERIIPLLIAGEPDESFPPELRRRRIAVPRADGSTDLVWEEVEPVAADVRPRKDEPKSKTERRALMRLAAALLGCKFDDLARRDEETRKKKLRRQLAAAAALLGVAGVGGLWWWDVNLRVKTQYCANYGERWAAPFCVGELSEAQQRARTTSFRFHIQGGRVLDMARVNGAGTAVDEQSGYEEEAWTAGVAEWRFSYRSDARFAEPLLASAVLYDKTGKQLREIGYEFSDDGRQAIARFDRNFGVAERQSAEGSALGLRKPLGKYEFSQHSSIGQHRLFFDAQGLMLRRAFEPVGGGASVADSVGAYGRTYEYGASGLPLAIRNLDALGDPLVEKTGIASIRRSYDERGDLTGVEWLDAKEQLRANEQWFAKVILVRNANGTIEKYSYLSETGAPTIRRDFGVASLSRKYDEQGNVIEDAYFDVDGRLSLTMDYHIARMTLKYDARGNVIEQAYFGIDGKPTLQKAGVARITLKHDAHGNETERACFGIDGKPTYTIEGLARVTWHYDARGNKVEQAYFDVEGRPTLNAADGIAGVRWRYDERGNEIGVDYFGVDGKSTLHKGSQIAGETRRYDERGNEIEVDYFGVDGKPTLSWEGVARMTERYDERGNLVELAYLGVDGKPILHENGNARVTRRYDERGNEVEEAFFGIDGKPTTLIEYGYASWTWRYDERGNVVEEAYFGTDGKPTLSKLGIARATFRSDERGNKVEETYYGVDGNPTLSKNGYARWTALYDERGNQVGEAYFGVDGKPVLSEFGVARTTARYDTRGNSVEQAYFGVDGKPTLHKGFGAARVTRRYDERGNQVEEAYFDVDDRSTLNEDGLARWSARYDERGNQIEKAVFDTEGHPVLVDGIGAEALFAYDDLDQRISTIYLDEQGRVIPVEVEARGNLPDSTAERIGLKSGDRLLSYDGELLRSTDQLIALVGKAKPGLKDLVYRRGETTVTVQVPPGRLGVNIANVRAAPPPAAAP